MIIERFNAQNPVPVYEHLAEKGRGMPDGLRYVDSWIEPNFDRCFQIMECDDLRLLQQWVLHWRDFATFEIVPVVPSRDSRETVAPFLQRSPSPDLVGGPGADGDLADRR